MGRGMVRENARTAREQWEQFGYEWAEVWLKIAHEQRARFGKALREMVEQFDARKRREYLGWEEMPAPMQVREP